MSTQDKVIALIAQELGEEGTANFDLELLERLANLLRSYSEPDFECSMLGASSVGGPVRNTGYGISGMREVVGDWMDAFEQLRAERIELLRVGESVVMELLQIATARGVEISTPSSIVFYFREERIVAIEFFLEQEAARVAAEAGFRPAEERD